MLSYLYILGSDKPPYKVGISRDPLRRLRAIQTGHPESLKIHHLISTKVEKTKSLEKAIHRNLRHLSHRGEWFHLELGKLILELDYVMIRYGDDPTLDLLIRENMI
jgi:Meiotically up-regulated gene 113